MQAASWLEGQEILVERLTFIIYSLWESGPSLKRGYAWACKAGAAPHSQAACQCLPRRCPLEPRPPKRPTRVSTSPLWQGQTAVQGRTWS